jgi:hypothetical protein
MSTISSQWQHDFEQNNLLILLKGNRTLKIQTSTNKIQTTQNSFPSPPSILLQFQWHDV